MFTGLFTPSMMKSLREALDESLSEFGWTLKRAIQPKAKTPYSKTYIFLLESGKKEITPKISAGLANIAGQFDGVPAGLTGAVQVMIYAQPGQVPDSGAFLPLGATVIKCARPGCPVHFIKTNPSQKYHDKQCRP